MSNNLRATRRRRVLGILALLALAVAGLLLATGGAQAAGTTERVSVASDGTQADAESVFPAISADGRYVAFVSVASNLVPGGMGGGVFVRDRVAGTTERISDGLYPSISADGRYIAFTSSATNLVPSDTNGYRDIFVRDRVAGTTERVSVASDGSQANGDSGYYDEPSISADGRYVAFESWASNLVASDTNSYVDVFIHDRAMRSTERISVASDGTEGDGDSYRPGISADGRYVAFDSTASNLVASDTNGHYDVFVRDRVSGTTERVSVASGGAQAIGGSYCSSISADGRYVAFPSAASNLVPSDTNGHYDVFVRDRVSGITERVSIAFDGTQANNGPPGCDLSISADGRYVAFPSQASNLVPTDTNGYADVFVRDRVLSTTERVSVASEGAQANDSSWYPSISADGRYVAFQSDASNLVPSDTNGDMDVFVRDRGAAPGAVVGAVNLQGRANEAGATISVGALTTTTTASGAFTISGVPAGVYTATAAMSGYLYAQRTAIVSDGVTTTLPTVTLLGGDANGDNIVNIYDLTALGAIFGASGGSADINGDGTVNVFDLVLVGANFGRLAPLPWL